MIARMLCATAQSEQAAVTMAEPWGEQVGRFERTAPGFQGAVLLREGVKLLAVSCWDGEGTAEAVLAPPGSCPMRAAGAGFARPCAGQRWDAAGAPASERRDGEEAPPPLRRVPISLAGGALYVDPR